MNDTSPVMYKPRRAKRVVVDIGAKRTSVLRRISFSPPCEYLAAPGLEGDVAVFQLLDDAEPIVVEAVCGRSMTLSPRDLFLGTPGCRESTRWVVGGIPEGGLVPGNPYWVLAECGIVGEFYGESPLEKGHLGQAIYHGKVRNSAGGILNIRQSTHSFDYKEDHGAPAFVLVGTSAEVGKTTAAVALLREWRSRDQTVVALKATGTASVTELFTYRDFGAAHAFDFLDFGLATTGPAGRQDIMPVFERMLDLCFSMEADAVLIECGSDMLGVNVPEFLKCLKRRRPAAKFVLAAPDAVAAFGGTQLLQQMGFTVTLITGACCDTPIGRARTEKLCQTPVANMARGEMHDGLF